MVYMKDSEFKVGDIVRLTEWGLKYSLTNSACLVRNGKLPNRFTIYKISLMSERDQRIFKAEGCVWVAFKECCAKMSCVGHPSSHFEKDYYSKEKVIFT